MPLGYEYGFRQRLDVVDQTPENYEWPTMNLMDYIQQVNRFKMHYPLLNDDGPMWQMPYPNLGVLILRKSSVDESQHMVLIYNKDWNNGQQVYLEDLRTLLPGNAPIYEINLACEATERKDLKYSQDLSPNAFHLLYMEERGKT